MNTTELLALADEYLNTNSFKPCNPDYLIKHLADALRPKKTRYDWDEAPYWVKWIATDKNGCIYYYQNKPIVVNTIMSTAWSCEVGNAKLIYCKDWKDSLEARPKTNEGL